MLIFLPQFILTCFVLRLVDPVVFIPLLISVWAIKVGVWARLTVVGRVELILAVKDASALAGDRGHAEPAESPGQAGRFFFAKRPAPLVPSHPELVESAEVERQLSVWDAILRSG